MIYDLRITNRIWIVKFWHHNRHALAGFSTRREARYFASLHEDASIPEQYIPIPQGVYPKPCDIVWVIHCARTYKIGITEIGTTENGGMVRHFVFNTRIQARKWIQNRYYWWLGKKSDWLPCCFIVDKYPQRYVRKHALYDGSTCRHVRVYAK